MQDTGDLSSDQIHIANVVKDKYSLIHKNVVSHIITPTTIDQCIAKLKRHSAPGIDGIVAEFLIYGRSMPLCKHLSAVYSAMLTFNYVPSIFNTGVMVPILKKPTLDPGNPGNYRPIIVSSVFSKLLEIILLPDDDVT